MRLRHIPTVAIVFALGIATASAAAAGMMVLAMVGTGGLAKAAHPGTNGRISFSALPCCAGPISTINADGSDMRPLTSGLISDWSPDG